MVKLGKIFSIILVFALLIVLAPALVPRAASADPVSAPPPPLPMPNPLTVSFSASVAYTGLPISFNVVPDPVNGSMGMQFSRPGVLYHDNMSGCKFYNISAASGTISGDLCGDIDLEWNRLDLNMEYPNATLQYISSPYGFGLLYIKGNLTTAELGNFPFIAVADHDYTGSTAKGAGRICTVVLPWENPALVNINGSLEEVLIGEITALTLTSSTISGALSLRYYNKTKGEIDNNWSYMYLDGILGGDLPDNITGPPNTGSLIQYTGDNIVQTKNDRTLAMEEAHPGRETPSRLVAGYIGENGTVTLRRTGIYTYVHVGDPDPAGMNLPEESVHAILNTLDNWVCNDTTKRGKSHSVVGVDMTDFTMDGVNQTSFSYMCGYSPGYEGEGYFKGFESWSVSFTHITLQSEVFGAYYDFVLRPTPVISSVSPNVGQATDTFNVTINGKWFLVDPIYHTLNVTFSDPNVTVNSHQMISDTEIHANITIAGGAGSGASDVKVFKLGLNGTMTDGFGVGGAADLQITFPGARVGSDVESFAVKVFTPTLGSEVWSGNAPTDSAGVLTITGLTPGTYDIGIKSAICVSQVNFSVNLSSGTNVVDLTIRSGDCDASDYVDMGDYSAFSTAFETLPCDVKWDAGADLDRNGYIDMGDYSMFCTYYEEQGDAWGKF